MKKQLLLGWLLILGLTATPVFGVENPSMGGANPTVINRENKMQLKGLELEKEYIEPVQEAPKKDNIKDEDKKDFVQGEVTYNPKFKLNKIIFEGNTKISDKKLQKLATDIVGKEIYLEDVLNLTIKVSRYYQKQGYLTSYAYLLPQEITNGVVVINIKESKVAYKESYVGRWEKEWYLDNLVLSGRGLECGKVFNAKDLQGAMKTIRREDYLEGSAEITKNKNEDTIIKLNVQDRFPLNFSVAWDDYGRNYTGRQRFTSLLGIDNLTGFGDKIYGGTILSQDSTGALAGYQIPINKYGTRLSFDYSYSNMTLGGPYRPLDIKGKAVDYALRLTHPIINTATKEISASVSVDALNSKTDSYALNQNLADYKLRVLRTGLYGMFDDKHGRTISSIGADMGANVFGASDNIDNGPQSVFYKIIASLIRVQRLPKDCLAVVRINGQYSPQSLYAAEQMYLGGAYSIRGYQPSELLGDYGVAGSFEIRTPVPGLKKVLPKKVKSWSDQIKLAFFYDWGYVNENVVLYDYPNNFLQSIGVGTYINLTDAVYVQFGVGIPVGPKYYNDDKARVYFSVNTDIDKIFLKPRERL